MPPRAVACGGLVVEGPLAPIRLDPGPLAPDGGIVQAVPAQPEFPARLAQRGRVRDVRAAEPVAQRYVWHARRHGEEGLRLDALALRLARGAGDQAPVAARKHQRRACLPPLETDRHAAEEAVCLVAHLQQGAVGVRGRQHRHCHLLAHGGDVVGRPGADGELQGRPWSVALTARAGQIGLHL